MKQPPGRGLAGKTRKAHTSSENVMKLGNGKPGRTLSRAIGLMAAIAAAPLAAQAPDPALGAEAVSVTGEGRVLVRNGETTFDCALVAGSAAVELGDCRPLGAATGDAAAALSDLTGEDWKALVRDTMLDAGCRLSALGAVADVVAAAAEANGASPETIAQARATLSARAEAAVDEMLSDGSLTWRDGELALDACP